MSYANIIHKKIYIDTVTTATNTKLVPSASTSTPSPSRATTTNLCPTSSIFPSSVSTLSGNCDTNIDRPIPPPRAKPAKAIKAATAAAASATQTLMIKSIENLSSQANGDEKDEEEEKEICYESKRRDSNIEDIASVNTNKLQIIQEQSEEKTSSNTDITKSEINENLSKAKSNISETGFVPTALGLNVETAISNLSANKEDAATVEQRPKADVQKQETEDIEIKNTITENIIQSINVEREPIPESVTDTAENESLRCSLEVAESLNVGDASTLSRNNSAGLGKTKLSKTPSFTKISNSLQSTLGGNLDEDAISKSSDTSGELVRGVVADSVTTDKPKSASRLSERAKKKSWYNVLYPNYKSRAEDFKKLFKEVPGDERLIVDYSCALQRDILVQGRLYVSQNYVCFHANIFRWETYLTIRWKDVTSITKEKTALVIPNAISICTAREKYFFATFTTRDKAFLMLFRVWQNTLMNKQMPPKEIWQWVHNCYGDELGLTTDDEDYIDPTSVKAKDTESGGDSEFVLAEEDCNSFVTAFSSDLTTAKTESIPISNNTVNIAAISSSASSVGASAVPAVSKPSRKKSYFFGGTHKAFGNSSTTTTTNTSTSGSDNKASDNNSSERIITKSIMNAKELTLTSMKPDEDIVGVRSNKISSSANESGSGGGSGASRETKSSTLKAIVAHDAKRKMPKTTRERDVAASNNQTNLPTDASGSSDSEDNKVPFIATAECSSTHEGRQLVHTILPINVDTLFSMLFSKSKFFLEFHAARKTENMSFNDWLTNNESKKTRTINLTVQLLASVGPKVSKVTENQEMRECSKPGELYSIDVTSVNAGIPYADSFNVLMHYCLVRTVDDHTMLSVHAQVKYKKSIWGVVKGFIEKNTWAGLEEYFNALQQALQSETCIPPAKAKSRRTRRGTTQVRPTPEDMPEAQIKTEPIEVAVATSRRHTPRLPVPTVQQPFIYTEPQSKHKWLSIFVISLLCFLIILNMILLFKLWSLEERIANDMSHRARIPNLAQLQALPSSNQDWVELLRQQEILHETELRKWHKVLQTAIELLKKSVRNTNMEELGATQSSSWNVY
ncbi:protein Aster-B isoform X3 [Eurosta solidaginis]|uniref:protein Aster-B isoform X3 n=1 Tax=Eurosta solidaginis TaxID=178769 RepID=UPI003530822C